MARIGDYPEGTRAERTDSSSPFYDIPDYFCDHCQEVVASEDVEELPENDNYGRCPYCGEKLYY